MLKMPRKNEKKKDRKKKINFYLILFFLELLIAFIVFHIIIGIILKLNITWASKFLLILLILIWWTLMWILQRMSSYLELIESKLKIIIENATKTN